MLSTIHNANSSLVPVHGSHTEVRKPVCIQDYNKIMGGVDQVLQPYNAMRKTCVWYKKLAVHLTQVAMYNAFVLYRSAGSRDNFLQYQEKVIKPIYTCVLFDTHSGRSYGGFFLFPSCFTRATCAFSVWAFYSLVFHLAFIVIFWCFIFWYCTVFIAICCAHLLLLFLFLYSPYCTIVALYAL